MRLRSVPTCCSSEIPAYLEFFGFGTATPDELRDLAQIQY